MSNGFAGVDTLDCFWHMILADYPCRVSHLADRWLACVFGLHAKADYDAIIPYFDENRHAAHPPDHTRCARIDTLPPEFRHRSIELIIWPFEETTASAESGEPTFLITEVDRIILPSREAWNVRRQADRVRFEFLLPIVPLGVIKSLLDFVFQSSQRSP